MNHEANRVRLKLKRSSFSLDVDLNLPAKGVTALFGPSGSGKTTVLRCVAGLERACDALVRIGTDCWQDDRQGLFVPTWRRAIGYVFQEASLFDHLDVRGNLRFGLAGGGRAGEERASLDAAIELLGIGALLRHRTHQLSGGERQRVAIARALVGRPRLLLLDEPMASLDVARKQEILPWLERLRDELEIPMLYVSHSPDEVARLANTLAIMRDGRVVAAGPIEQVFAAADANGAWQDEPGALLSGRAAEIDRSYHLARIDFRSGSLWLRDEGFSVGESLRVRVLARDVSLTLDEPGRTSIQNHWRGVVETIESDRHPSQVRVRVRCGEDVLLARITRRSLDQLAIRADSVVWAQVKSVALVR